MEIMSPRNALIILTAINLFNYIDRYLLLALMPAIRTEIPMSHTQAGFVMSAFMLGYMVSSPFFGYLADRMKRTRLILGGTIAWSILSALTGLANSVGQLFGLRVGIGIGEASTVSTAQGMLADLFSKDKRNLVIGLFTAAIPLGAGLGYGIGGLLNHLYGWRLAFIITGVPGLFLALLMIRFPEPKRGSHDDNVSEIAIPSGFFNDIKTLVKSRDYMMVVLAYTAFTFCVGGLAAWAPQYLVDVLKMDLGRANTTFGAITVICGFAGSVLGGIIGTKMLRKRKSGDIYFAAISCFIAIPFTFAAFLGQSETMFLVCAGVALFFLFLGQPAINVAVIETASPYLRSTAVAFCVFVIHILGDFISPPLVGFLADMTGNLKTGAIVLPIGLIPCGILLWIMANPRATSKHNL